MDGQLAHALATSLWGDRWLTHESTVEVASFEDEHSTMALVSDVEFLDPVGHSYGSLAEWLQELRRQGVQRLRVVLGDDHPGYAIYADGPAPTVWVPQWSVGNFGDPRGKIWTVSYRGQLLASELPAPELTVEDASEALQAAVSRCLAFSRAQKLAHWQAIFDQARRTLGIGTILIPDYPDLIPAGVPAMVRRLLAASVQTQISSPMDAWPNLRFDDPAVSKEFRAAARQVQAASLEGLVAATAGARRGPRPVQKTELPGFVKRLLPKRGKANEEQTGGEPASDESAARQPLADVRAAQQPVADVPATPAKAPDIAATASSQEAPTPLREERTYQAGAPAAS